ERAQRKQVGGNLIQVQTDGSEKQREGNRQRDNQRAPRVAEKQKQDDGDENDPLGEVVQNRVGRVMQQVAAIQMRNDAHSMGKDVFVQFLYFFVNCVQRFIRVR